MHRKHKFHKFHSIPIGLCNCNKQVSYSIPLSCMVVLLLGGIIAINPYLPLKSSAVTIQDEWVVKEKDDSSSDINNVSENDINGSANTLSDADAGISVASVVPAPTLAITVSNTGQEINAAQGGNTVYGSYNVSLTGSNVKDYTLSIKANSTNLTMPSGASSSTSTVSGAGGKTGNSMVANTWGYKLTETSTSESSYGTLNYASLPTSLQQIANGTVSSPYNLSVGKKLVFAAKFGDNAAPGKYSGSITLSLSATPAQTGQLWSNGTPSYITDMQDIKSGFCKDNSNISTGTTITLTDKRANGGTTSYKIVKLGDGKCWMQENLKLGGDSTIELKSSDTALASGTSSWILPASSDSSWSSNNTLSQIRVGKDGMAVSTDYPGDGNGWQFNYGNYYSWCAATAGSCSSVTTGGAVAGSSICPKNWHLPTGNTNGELYNLTNGLNMSDITGGSYRFPAAGFIYDSRGFVDPGTYGGYWSSTAPSGTNAYLLYFNSSYFRPGTTNDGRRLGYSVRCVADY